MTETVSELSPDSTGRWLVTTAGSTHVWDLDRRTYCRTPGPRSGSGASPGDGEPLRILDVRVWPRVGERFHLTYASRDDYGEQWFSFRPWNESIWRLSSEVQSIERIG